MISFFARLVLAMTLTAMAPLAPAAADRPDAPDASSPGDAAARIQLATRYEHAEGVPRDLQKAGALYCLSAKEGDAEALFRLGWLYAHGRGVPRDDGIAAALFDMAAAKGHEYAARMLRYVHKVEGTTLPACLEPDPPPVVAAVEPPQTEVEKVAEPQDGPIARLVRQLAPQYAVDPQLVMAVIAVESAFNPNAVSPKKAQGLMQLMPGTAERFGVRRVFDPAENIRGGLAYLRWLLAYFEGDVKLVLAAYNAGERAVERYRGIPPYAETRAYVKKISLLYRKSSHPFDPGAVGPSAVILRTRRGGA